MGVASIVDARSRKERNTLGLLSVEPGYPLGKPWLFDERRAMNKKAPEQPADQSRTWFMGFPDWATLVMTLLIMYATYN